MIVSLVVVFIGYLQCFNDEDMILFMLGCFMGAVGFISGAVGLITGNDFFEM